MPDKTGPSVLNKGHFCDHRTGSVTYSLPLFCFLLAFILHWIALEENMKRIIILMVTMLIVVTLVTAKALEDGASPWELLQASKSLTNLKIYTAPPSDDPVEPYLMDMQVIRQELEKAGIKEAVKIELRSKSQKVLARIGKFKPSFSDSIPDTKKFYIMDRKQGGESTFYKEQDGIGTGLPDTAVLYFKGKKKNSAKIVITLTHIESRSRGR